MKKLNIEEALLKQFKSTKPEHQGLAIWHDGKTLGNSSIQISRELDSGITYVDILSKKGQGKGNIKDITKLKKKFNALRPYLPPGDYQLNADHPTKNKLYIREYGDQPGVSRSDEFFAGKKENKRTGQFDHHKYKTLVMNVPEPWTEKNGVYTLNSSPNVNKQSANKHLRNHISRKITKQGGNKGNISAVIDGVPHRIGALDKFNAGEVQRIEFRNLQTAARGKAKRSVSKLAQTNFLEPDEVLTDKNLKAMKAERLAYWDNTPSGKLHAHHTRMIAMYEPFFEGLSETDQKRLTRFATGERYPLGDVKKNIALLDEKFHTELHNYMKAEGFQLHGGGVTTKHGIPALGNTFASRKAALSKFFTNVQDPIEKKMYSLEWEQHAELKPRTPAQLQHELEWINDTERRLDDNQLLNGKRNKQGISQLGDRLGGEPVKLIRRGVKGAGRTGLIGSGIALTQAAGAAMSGDYVQAGGRLVEAVTDTVAPAASMAIGGALDVRYQTQINRTRRKPQSFYEQPGIIKNRSRLRL